jgi:hypothetical protein
LPTSRVTYLRSSNKSGKTLKKLEAEGGGDVVKENAMLRTQYEALVKEIEEKSKLMDE